MPLAVPRAPRRSRENRTRYVVLGMLMPGPATGYALRQRIAMSVGHFWQESYGQLYPTLRQLAAEGLVAPAAGRAGEGTWPRGLERPARGAPGRPAAPWAITAEGRAALASWLALPPAMPPHRNELLLKVFFAGAVPPEVTARNLGRVAAEVRAEYAELAEIGHLLEGSALATHPDARYWQLTLDFGLSLSRAVLDWLDRAEAVLGDRSPRPRASGPRAAPQARARRRLPARRPEGTR